MSNGAQSAVILPDGANLHYEIRGEGEPLLLLHGMTGCAGDWAHAGRDDLEKEYQLILPDARGHGRSTNPGRTFSHRQCAVDTLALLDHLGVESCKAIGMSMGGNTLLHMATRQPGRIDAMVVISATMYFPDQARALMRQVPVESQPESEWQIMRERHRHGDEQITLLWEHQRALKDSHDDMNFTPPLLSTITARTLVVYGDRDPLYPVEMAVEMYRAIPRSALWVVPGDGHGPIFLDAAPAFVGVALDFLRG
jgi:pimeloyl-ACP methyl ester carboxylesterase